MVAVFFIPVTNNNFKGGYTMNEAIEKSDKVLNRKRREIAPANELIKKPFMNEFEVAAVTGRAVSTLRNERFLRKGLPYLKVSKRSIRYLTADVIKFMEARRIDFNEVA